MTFLSSIIHRNFCNLFLMNDKRAPSEKERTVYLYFISRVAFNLQFFYRHVQFFKIIECKLTLIYAISGS